MRGVLYQLDETDAISSAAAAGHCFSLISLYKSYLKLAHDRHFQIVSAQLCEQRWINDAISKTSEREEYRARY